MRHDFTRRASAALFSGMLLCVMVVGTVVVVRAAPAQQVVDRIVVRIEDDIITLSEMHELAAYQQLLDGKAEPDDRLVSELIEQWVVNAEATAAQFPAALDSEVDREAASIESNFTDSGRKSSSTPPQTYLQRLGELGLTPDSVHRMVRQEIYLARYLDYKFRPSVQIEDAAIEAYYQKELAPSLAAKNQPLPPLDDVRETIRELLVQQGITQRASSWFEDTKSRLNIEIEPAAGLGAAAGSLAPNK
jgi:hypothetical protein